MKKGSQILTPDRLQIIVCCHKACVIPKSPYLLPVHVGAALSGVELGMQRDDEFNHQPCDNISMKNSSYCELTAVYWAWKNLRRVYPNIEYVGVNHYRRYFAFGRRALFDDKIVYKESEVSRYEIDVELLSSVLAGGRMVAAKRKAYPYPLTIDYSCWNLSKDLRVLRDVVLETHPEYDKDFIDLMCFNNRFSLYNMFIMKWNDFENYCDWLFSILFNVEHRVDTTCYTSNYARIFGYMAERLLNVWILHNRLHVQNVPIAFYGDCRSVPLPRRALRGIRAEIGFNCIRPLSKSGGEAFFKYPTI